MALLAIDALVLGLAGCALGLLVGDELSIRVFHSNPAFLSLAFAVDAQRVVGWQSIVIATGGGMLAATVAVLSPVRDAISRDPFAATRPRGRPGAATAGIHQALAALVCLGAATEILAAQPQAAMVGMVLLTGALLLALPIVFSATVALVRVLASAVPGAIAHIATSELLSSRTRAVAIATTGAVAVFGSVAVQGAHSDLLAGLDSASRETNASTDVWVAPAGSYNLLETTPFAPTQQRALEQLPGIRAVHVYRGGLLDWGDRRVLVIAPSRAATPLVPPTQITSGGLLTATARVRAGGWLILSQALASSHHLHVGQAFELPTPDPRAFRLAAISTNLGWAPGAIIMNASDYALAWGSRDASAFSIVLAAGLSQARGAREIQRALGARSALRAQGAAQHARQQEALSRRALARLGQISTLILLAAVLAMSTAIAALILRGRARMATLKLDGFCRGELWRAMLLEGSALLAVGCITGAAFGLYGQRLADRVLAEVVNFPVVRSTIAVTEWESIAVMVAATLAIIAIPGYLAAGVSPTTAVRD
jgi:putative ABC transport system permease protein